LDDSTHPPPTRPDIVVRVQVHRNSHYAVVKDPVTGRFFRLPEMAWKIAGHFNSNLDYRQIAFLASEREESDISAEDVQGVAEQLERLGLLDQGLSRADIASRQEAVTLERRSILYLKRPLVDPDRFLSGLLAAIRPLVSFPFVVLVVVLVCCAAILHAIHPHEAAQAMASSLRGWGLAWLYGMTALTLTLHEIAHGLACKRFGAEVREMGVMLLYFMPCAYTDISDAYLVPKKQNRIWITMAGSVADLAVWSAATIALATLHPVQGPLLQALGALMLTTGLRSVVFNLNPLIRLDGYYVLVDLLEMPNLRLRAREVVRWRVANWLGRASARPDETARDRRILEAYGWLSLVYVVALLSMSAVLAAQWLVELTV